MVVQTVQRLRLDALHYHAGRLCRHDEPFDGIAYEVLGNHVVANYHIAEGVLGGPAEVWDPGRLRVLGQALTIVAEDETDERFPAEGAYLDGTLFHGIAYAFDQKSGVLWAETDYHPTDPGPSREWYLSGALRNETDRPRSDGTTESESWHANGQSAGVSSVNWGFGLTPDGCLRTLQLDSGCPEDVLRLFPREVDTWLSLSGPGVTDAVLAQMVGLSRVVNLELNRTGLSAAGLERFRACSSIKKLTTRGNMGFGDLDVRGLLTRLPECMWDPCRKCPRCGNRTYSGTAWMTAVAIETAGAEWMKCPGCGYEVGVNRSAEPGVTPHPD